MSTSGGATLHYLDGDQYLGCREVCCAGYTEQHSAYYPNTAFFCTQCGELWARAVYNFSFDYVPIPQTPWAITLRPCVKCGDGTLLDTSLEGASLELLTRELLALLERYHYE